MHRLERPFRGVIESDDRACDEACHTGNADDMAAPLLAQQWQSCLDHA